MSNYYKYIKYKTKYTELSNNLIGGAKSNNSRSDKYYKLSTDLSYLSNVKVNEFINAKQVKAWGITQIINFNKQKLFLKVIPLAKLFYRNQFDTSNLYNLPSYYNYGFGSAGCNPWRELLIHIKTTKWVLEDKYSLFPLLYHYRIIKNDNKNFETGLNDKLMKRWNNNKFIKKYLTDRSNSEYKIVLFMEYIPYVAGKYMEKNPNFVKNYYEQASKIIKFLNSQGIIHNDAHLFNYLVDKNENVYLTDFGLSLDKSFNLTKDEIKFMKKNKKIDKYYITDSIFANYFNLTYWNEPIKKKYGLDKIDGYVEISKHLVENIDTLSKEIKMSKFQLYFIKKYKTFIIKYITWQKKFQKAKNKKDIFIP